MDYSTFSENPSLYFLNIFLAIALTLLFYGTGPVLFAFIRKRQILKKRFRLFCILYTITVAILFMALRFIAEDNVGTFSPALIWGIVFYRVGLHILRSRGKLLTVDVVKEDTETSTTPIVEVYRSPYRISTEEKKQDRQKTAYKIGCVVLSVALICSLAFSGVLYTSERDAAAALEDAEFDAYIVQQQMDEKDSAIASLRSENNDLQNENVWFMNNIGFIVNGSSYYHNYRCSIFQRASEYWAHNIEYCAYIGYSQCPNCW